MERSYDINEAPDDDALSERREIDHAKIYLQKYCAEAGDTLYNHLSEVLNRILTERPRNPFALFDKYSRKLRDNKFQVKNDYLQDVFVGPAQFEDAKIIVNLFKENLAINEDDRSLLEEENEDFKETKIDTPNLPELFYYFEQVDVGLPRGQVVLLNLSIRKLVVNTKIEDVRFWGKIFGRSKNYYIVEARLPDYEIERRLQLLEEEQRQSLERLNGDVDADEQTDAEKKQTPELALETELSDGEGGGEEFTVDSDTLKLTLPSVPTNTWEPAPKVFPEKLGTGVNAKVYFVCNAPGLDDWVELPEVTPEQIVVARQIVHTFTGNLEAEIYTFPPFPGCEKNYLRAQIARIGAATQVSPIGYYGQDDEEGEEEEDEQHEENDDDAERQSVEEGEGSRLVPNRHYKPLPAKELANPANWCHHAPYILKQGREVWLEPGKADNGSDQGEESEAEGEEAEDLEEDSLESKEARGASPAGEKEIGPGLLRPLSEEAAADWTGRLSSTAQPAVALVRSTLWPGAFAFAADGRFGNLYVGWGQKQRAFNYSPPAMPGVQEQYVPIFEELKELREPSFEEEEAYRLAHLAPEDDEEDAEEEDEEDDEEEGDTDDEQV